MLKRLALAAALAATGLNAHALGAGDLAFTAFNSQEDGFSLVALTGIAANTTVYFTDNEWNGSAIGAGGAFNAGESYSQWVSGPAAIAAGTVIRFSAVDSATLLAASVGSFSRATVSGSTNWGISATADSVYAYVGSAADTPTAFIAAVTNDAAGFSIANGQLTNTGLAAGVNAIALSGAAHFTEYTGARSGAASFAAYLPALSNVANWSASVDNVAAVPNGSAFTIAAVPEPQSVAMLLAGLGAVGFMTRRRGAR